MMIVLLQPAWKQHQLIFLNIPFKIYKHEKLQRTTFKNTNFTIIF